MTLRTVLLAFVLGACGTPVPTGTPHPAADDRVSFTRGAHVDVGAADVVLASVGSPEEGDWTEYAYAVDMPGDLDGDGFDDLLVRTSSISGPDFAEPMDGFVPAYNRVRVGIVYGGPAFFEAPPRVDAGISSVWVWGGETAREVDVDPFAELRVTPAGDVDGDGAVDLLFSVRNGGCQQGNVYLVHGGTRLSGEHDVRALGSVLREEEECSGFGLASALGDLDGDGLDDFVVASPGRTSGAPARVYLYYGDRTRSTERRSEAHADAVLVGGIGWTGDAVPLGDLDGDGYDDAAIAVDARYPSTGVTLPQTIGRDYAGSAPHLAVRRILHGGPRLAGMHALDDVTALEGVSAGIAGLRDLDGDGLAEAAMFGATDVARAVRQPAHILSGSAERSPLFPRWSFDEGASDVTWVQSAGDVNGDSEPDLLVGLSGNEGRVTLLLGPHAESMRLEAGITFVPRTFEGAFQPEDLAADAAGGSDLDGDGLDDLAIVSSEAPATEPRAQGQVLVFRGRR